MFVKPGPHPDHPEDATKHRAVRIPHTFGLLPPGGQEVPDNSFWRRRVVHGDVVLADPPTSADEAPIPDAPAHS